MTNKEAIKAIKSNYPTSGYTILKEALDIAMEALEKQIERETLVSGAKRCPFCGGEATLKPEGDYHEVTCDDCGVSRQGRTYDDAINEWNRRW